MAFSGERHSSKNIFATGQFVVNIVSEPLVAAVNATSIDGPDIIDEWLVSGLTPLKSDLIKPARVAECAVSFECEVTLAVNRSSAVLTPASAVQARRSWPTWKPFPHPRIHPKDSCEPVSANNILTRVHRHRPRQSPSGLSPWGR
jgi:flavin reductase (DIM6/NTAB) family NADH-FMN oxidoreductase RutF